MNCEFCGKINKSNIANSQHQIRCSKNPNRIKLSGVGLGTNKIAWNKNLTKETDNRVLKSVQTRKANYENGSVIPHRTKHTDETKKKISLTRRKYLKENPDQIPWVLFSHSKGESYPEKYFREVLESNNITYIQEKQVSLYSLDFVINNINLEIDGEQHYINDQLRPSDIKRTKYLEELGYKSIRVRWSKFKKLNEIEKQIFCNNLILLLCL